MTPLVHLDEAHINMYADNNSCCWEIDASKIEYELNDVARQAGIDVHKKHACE